MKKDTGLWIVFEGPEASGKSVLAKALYHKLGNKNSILTREPGSLACPVCQNIRSEIFRSPPRKIDSTSTIILFLADRILHEENVVLPMLETNNGIVIQDRGWISTLVYQCMGGDYLTSTIAESIVINVMRGRRRFPDIFVLCTVDPIVQRDRILNRNSSTQNWIDTDFDLVNKTTDNYNKIVEWVKKGAKHTINSIFCRLDKNARFILVDTSKSDVETLTNRIEQEAWK